MNAVTIDRSRYQGVAQIFRFNWPQYATSAACAVVAASLLMTRSMALWVNVLLVIGISLAMHWTIASLVVSHVVYDRSRLRRWEWITAAIGAAPDRWVNIHCGLDESSDALHRLFPDSRGRVLDMFVASEMSEPSISRARVGNGEACEHVDYRRLPLGDGSVDAAFLLLSAHELRRPASRVAFLREVKRSLAADGRIVLAEHLRDAANFFAFGPGFIHFHSRAAWLRAIEESGLAVENSFHITPFVSVMILRRSS